MGVSVAHRVSRDLGNLPSYRQMNESSLLPELNALISLVPNEAVIGMYQNSPDKFDNAIVITNYGLHFLSKQPRFIPYDSIGATRPYSTDKTEMIEQPGSRLIVIELTNGESVNIPVVGAQGRMLDMAPFLGFLTAVAEDARSNGLRAS